MITRSTSHARSVRLSATCLLLFGVLFGAVGCKSKGTCERPGGEGVSSICGDAGERELCEKIGGKFTEGKTCEAMGYQCDEHGNNCSKK